MAAIPYSEQHLAENAAAFAATITPAKERWEYCAARATYESRLGYGICVNDRTIPVVARILGTSAGRAKLNLQRLRRKSFEDARAEANAFAFELIGDRFAVGPMQAWHVGHLYFARVVSHPHVVKIGFSRRVRARLDDIESKVKSKIEMRPGEIRVGTLADEHWWHKNWSDHRISGEWFFDPHMSDRSLPDFLREDTQSVAA